MYIHFPLFMWPFFTFHVGKYTSPMDPMGDYHGAKYLDFQGRGLDA